MAAQPVGFFTKGRGKKAKHIPITPATGRPVKIPQTKRRLIEGVSEVEGIYCEDEGIIKSRHCGKCGQKEDYRKSHEPREYTINLTYADGYAESVKTVAHSPEEAIHMGMMKSTRRQERPTEVTAKNSLGDIVGKLGRWVGKGLKAVGKVAWKGTKAVGKAVGKAATQQYAEYRESAEVKKLVRQAFSPNKTNRTLARSKLAEEYPAIYKVILEGDKVAGISAVPPAQA